MYLFGGPLLDTLNVARSLDDDSPAILYERSSDQFCSLSRAESIYGKYSYIDYGTCRAEERLVTALPSNQKIDDVLKGQNAALFIVLNTIAVS